MMSERITLSTSQRNQLENYKQLYVLLRMIHFVEKYYSYDKIDSNTYKVEINKLIEKYNRFTQVIPNYNLQQFMKKYHISLDQISWAKLVLEKGVHSQNQGKQTFLYMQATAKFIEVIESLSIKEDNPVISDLKTPLEQLQLLLRKLYTKLGNDFTYKFQQYQALLKRSVSSKSINESLTQSEFKQIKLNVEAMYRMMEIIMKN